MAKPVISLDGKIILITGAGRGLGRAYAEGCCEAGAAVIIAELREELGREAAAELTSLGFDATFIPLDLAEPESVRAMADEIAGKFSHIDGLVNNGALADGIGGKTFEETTTEEWDRVMNVNVRGSWLTVKECAPMLRKSTAGRVLNIASDTAMWGPPRVLHYNTSKAAIIGMTRSLARELGPDEITVNAVAPGLAIVPATESMPEHRHQQAVNARAIARKQYPEDVVGTVLYFLSDASGFVTGQVLPVNGGFVFN
jgi:NAD(P)-dependent dehydrogenase (short-subunit alcohol dehydrogenase family)